MQNLGRNAFNLPESVCNTFPTFHSLRSALRPPRVGVLSWTDSVHPLTPDYVSALALPRRPQDVLPNVLAEGGSRGQVVGEQGGLSGGAREQGGLSGGGREQEGLSGGGREQEGLSGGAREQEGRSGRPADHYGEKGVGQHPIALAKQLL